jgi:hypothetical protein
MNTLEAATPEVIQKIRDNLVDRLNEKIDVPWRSEEDEKKAYRAIVDYFLSFYLGNEFTMTPQERLDDVEHDMKLYKMQLEAVRENSASKEKVLVANIKVLKKDKRQILRKINGGPRFRFLKVFAIFKVLKFWK